MKCTFLSVRRLVPLGLLAMLAIGAPAAAQYIYLDTNGDGVSTWADSLNTVGTTVVDVWLNTGSNGDGSPGFCGAPGLASYQFILQSLGGNVSWGAYTNTLSGFATVGALMSSSATENHIAATIPGGAGATTPLGLYKLGTLNVNVTSGTPCMAIGASSSMSPRHATSFGGGCHGPKFDHTARFGSDWSSSEVLPATPSAPPLITAPGILVPKYLDPIVVDVQATTTNCGIITALSANLAGLPPGHNAVFTPGPGNLTGTLTWQPTPADRGEFAVTFTGTGRNPNAHGTKTTTIHLVTDPVAVDGAGAVEPIVALWQNRPNPFNPATTILYSIPRETHVRLIVYDLAGRVVARLIDRVESAGQHEARWSGQDDRGRALASGVYCYRLSTPFGSETRRLVLAR